MERAESHLRALIEFSRIASVSTSSAGLEEASAWLLDRYGTAADWVDVMRQPDGTPVGMLLDFASGRGRRLVFYNYFDVTPPGDTNLWIAPPFDGEIREGRLIARGAAANKGDLIARLEAISDLAQAGRLERNIVVWLDGEEELGSPSLEIMLERWRKRLECEVAIWNTGYVNADGVPIVSIGYKGNLILRLSKRSEVPSSHSGVGIGTSAIHDLLRAVSPLLEERGLERFESIGRRALPDRDVGLGEETRLIDPLVEQARQGLFGQTLQQAPRRELVRRALFQARPNLPWLSGGSPEELTRYADRAECVLEIRLVPPQEGKAVLDEVTDYLRLHGIDCTVVANLEPYVVPEGVRGSIERKVEVALTAAFGRPPRLLPVAPHASAAKSVSAELGAVVIGLGMTDSEAAPHGFNESVDCTRFGEMIHAITGIIQARDDRDGKETLRNISRDQAAPTSSDC